MHRRLTTLAVVVVVAAAALAVASTRAAPTTATPMPPRRKLLPPILPQYYEANFVEYTALTAPPPPYINGLPPAAPPSRLYSSKGFTYYDWSVKSMIEQRFEYCVNVFPFSNNFSCSFVNVNNISYLTSNGTSHLPPCCVYGDPWMPPPPDFLRTREVTTVANTSVRWRGRRPTDSVTWFSNLGIPPPDGPFLYAYTELRREPAVVLPNVAVFDCFSFPGVQGWVQQNFYNQKAKKPHPSVWNLPQECLPVSKLQNCGFFNVDHTRYKPFGSK